MTGSELSFGSFDLDEAIAQEVRSRGIVLADASVRLLVAHAREVERENSRLHLTAIVDPREFVARHVAEAFDGATILDPEIRGSFLDLGSGNGYPGLPIAIARPGLRLVLAEASSRKAEFLRGVIALGFANATVLGKQIQRGSDLQGIPPIDVMTVRAVGGWSRILPRLASSLSETGRVLLWAGEDVERVRTRVAWRRLIVEAKQEIEGRERSWIWVLRRAAQTKDSESIA